MIDMLLSLKRSGSIRSQLYNKLCSSAGKTLLMYALPKTHKPDVPLRPIVSFIHSPTYQLSKHLVSILSPIIGNSLYKVCNPSDFADFINFQSLQSDENLVYFSVVSLFTNVPVDLAAHAANDQLHHDSSLADHTGLSPDQVTSLLRFCLNATYLAYSGKFYKQTFGTAMGSPVSVTVADLVTECALSTFLTPPRFWKHYIDETCIALPGPAPCLPSPPQLYRSFHPIYF